MATANEGSLKRELLIFFYKYRLRLLVSFMIPLLIMVAVSFMPTPRYSASGTLIVRMGSEYVYTPEVGNTGNGPANIIPFNQEQIFKAEVAILGSYDLHEEVVRQLGVEKLYPNLIQPTGVRLYISQAKNLVEDEIKKALNVPEQPQPSAEEKENMLVAKAVEIFEKRFSILLEKESAVISLTYEHADPRIATEALDLLLKLYFEKRRELYTETRGGLAKKEYQASKNKALWTAQQADSFKRNNMIYSLGDQRAELLKRRAEYERQLSIIMNPDIERKVAEINIQLDELDSKEHTYNNLKREADLAAKSYDSYAGKFDEASSYDAFQKDREDSVRMIQSPVSSPEAKSIQALIIIGGIFLSIITTLLVAAITEFSRSGFMSPEQVERQLGIPVLAAIPRKRAR